MLLLSGNQEATEKQINEAMVEQARLKFELVQLEEKELDSLAAAEKSRLVRSGLGKAEIEQQRLLTQMAEQEARGAKELAETAEDRQQAEDMLTKAAEQRVKLSQMEREEAKKLRDLAFERAQLENTDPFTRAEGALDWARNEAGFTAARPDAAAKREEQAQLDVLRALQALLEAARLAGPSMQSVAGSGNAEMIPLSREANRGALTDAAPGGSVASQAGIIRGATGA